MNTIIIIIIIRLSRWLSDGSAHLSAWVLLEYVLTLARVGLSTPHLRDHCKIRIDSRLSSTERSLILLLSHSSMYLLSSRGTVLYLIVER
jgi:hypothetical protein